MGRFQAQFPNMEDQPLHDLRHSGGCQQASPGWLPFLVSQSRRKPPRLGYAQRGANALLPCGVGRASSAKGAHRLVLLTARPGFSPSGPSASHGGQSWSTLSLSGARKRQEGSTVQWPSTLPKPDCSHNGFLPCILSTCLPHVPMGLCDEWSQHSFAI